MGLCALALVPSLRPLTPLPLQSERFAESAAARAQGGHTSHFGLLAKSVHANASNCSGRLAAAEATPTEDEQRDKEVKTIETKLSGCQSTRRWKSKQAAAGLDRPSSTQKLNLYMEPGNYIMTRQMLLGLEAPPLSRCME